MRSNYKIKTRWLTTKDVALYLGTSVGGVRNRVYRGDLVPHKPFGQKGRTFFDKDELDRFILNSRLGGIYGYKRNK